jgi:hypothetical protein
MYYSKRSNNISSIFYFLTPTLLNNESKYVHETYDMKSLNTPQYKGISITFVQIVQFVS